MLRIELTTALPASAEAAWAVLVDAERWPEWGRFVTSAEGEFVPGARWAMTLRPRAVGGAPRTMRPRFVSMEAPRSLAFETRIGTGWAVRILHTFVVEPAGSDAAVLRQCFEVTGLLRGLLGNPVRRGVVQFDELGADLARRLGSAH